MRLLLVISSRILAVEPYSARNFVWEKYDRVCAHLHARVRILVHVAPSNAHSSYCYKPQNCALGASLVISQNATKREEAPWEVEQSLQGVQNSEGRFD
jgi:hypothetical protein